MFRYLEIYISVTSYVKYQITCDYDNVNDCNIVCINSNSVDGDIVLCTKI